jgi:hypothetical protein
MITDDEKRYEDLRHFIMNSGSPARGARFLISYEEAMKADTPTEDDDEASFRQ